MTERMKDNNSVDVSISNHTADDDDDGSSSSSKGEVEEEESSSSLSVSAAVAAGANNNNNNNNRMITNYDRPSYFRQTRKRGKIYKTLEERYIRQDLGFGTTFSSSTTTTTGTTTTTISTIEQLLELLIVLPKKKKKNNNNKNKKKNEPPSIVLIVVDTNVLLHNLDVLEEEATTTTTTTCCFPNLVISQTALQECRNRSLVAYNRVLQLLKTNSNNHNRLILFFPDVHHGDIVMKMKQRCNTTTKTKSINDENDLRIQLVAEYFAQQLRMNETTTTSSSSCRVVLLTDDRAFRERIRIENKNKTSMDHLIVAKSVRDYVKEFEQQQQDGEKGVHSYLLDRVAQYGGKEEEDDDDDNMSSSSKHHHRRKMLFQPHLEKTILDHGIQSGKFHCGVFRSERGSTTTTTAATTTGYVTIRKGEERVAVTIGSSQARNRAVDGDVVAIALNPLEEWIGTTTTTNNNAPPPNDKGSSAGIANETAEPTQAEMDNVADAISVVDAKGTATTTRTTDTTTTTTSLLRPTGKVVGILRRNFSTYCGSILTVDGTSNPERKELIRKHQREHPYQDSSTTTTTTICVFFPVDNKIPPILLQTTQELERLVGQRLEVAMDAWPPTSALPLGHYVRTIGQAGSKNVETQVLLHQHKIPHEPFSAAVLACLPPKDYRMSLEEEEEQDGTTTSTRRMDLRHLPILSIDPPGCKDIDDALHCIELDNGNWQIGVHIADVTHYVKPGTAMDLEAANRSTSTYLVNKRLDMLPSLLTTDLCSLRGNVDRYAFSVLWEVTPQDANILNVEFTKSMIHSIGALTYAQAQACIDDPKNGDPIQSAAIHRLAKCARIFRKRRIHAGALTLASPEVKFVLDDSLNNNNPIDVQSYTLLEANALVEEFMLLANVTVAKKILRHYPTLSVLRRHPAPNRHMFDSLISKAKCRGLEIDIETSKRLADSLDEAGTIAEQRDDLDPYVNRLLRILSTRCMSPAQYFCSGEYKKPTDWHHYGLAAPVYTHFTSPIRRYADVIVHRLLAASIGVAPLPTSLSSKSHLHDLTSQMNRRHRAAQLAGRASVQLHTLIFFCGNDNIREEDAYVLDIAMGKDDNSVDGGVSSTQPPSLTVLVPRYGIEGRVVLSHQLVSDRRTTTTRTGDDGSSSSSNQQQQRRRRLVKLPEQHTIKYMEYGTTKEEKELAKIQVFDKVRVRLWVQELENHERELKLDLLEPKHFAQQQPQQQQVVRYARRDDDDDTANSPDDDSNKKQKQKKRRMKSQEEEGEEQKKQQQRRSKRSKKS